MKYNLSYLYITKYFFNFYLNIYNICYKLMTEYKLKNMENMKNNLIKNSSDKNNSLREIINTENPDEIHIIHRAKFSPKYNRLLKLIGTCFPFTCLLCNIEEYEQSTYAQIHENRVEYNYPMGSFYQSLLTCLGINRLSDNVKVHYFDKDVGQNMSRAKCCYPLCTHNICCPECFGIFGESVIMYSDGLCCRSHVSIDGLDNADLFISEYEKAKAEKNSKIFMKK